MPFLKKCRRPGCFRMAAEGSDFCDKHQSPPARLVPSEDRRESAAQRGYGHRWRKLRDWYIKAHPLCEECLRQGRVTKATDVDHIIPHKGDALLLFDVNNLQSLCHECHSRKTAGEDGGFGNRSTPGGRFSRRNFEAA